MTLSGESYVPDVRPSGLEVDFDTNITELYEAITNCDWDAAVSAAERNPAEARTWVVRHYDEEDSQGAEEDIMWRFLPIHSACARQPPAAVIKALLHAYPEGVKCIDDQGMFALHYACGNQASRDAIRMLLMSFPDAAKIRDPRGMLPIHYLACWGPSSISVVDMVLVANRDVADAKDEDGNTALDLARDGEYAEKDAVVSALIRWLGNSSSQKKTEEKKEGEGLQVGAKAVASPTVGRLRQEVTTLQKSKKTLENSYEDSTTRIQKLEEELNRVYQVLETREAQLNKANEEIGGLRKTLADMTEGHEKSKKKAEILSDRLGSLNASLYSMVEQQSVVMDTMKAREEQWTSITKLRKEKMKELLALEEEGNEGADLMSSLVKQTKEMQAIQAVIAAVRQSD